jgi:hypothetical protein
MWRLFKEYVTRKNVGFSLGDAMEAREMFRIITKEEWSLRCNNAHQCKQNYLRLEPTTDDISE